MEGKAASDLGTERVSKSIGKSMLLQELMHVFGQLAADTFGRGDFVRRRLTQAIHRAELSQQQILAVLTHARAIVKNAFANPFFHQQLVICVGEAMRLVTNALEQSQGAGVHWKLQRQRPVWPVNLFPFLGQADNGKIVQV